MSSNQAHTRYFYDVKWTECVCVCVDRYDLYKYSWHSASNIHKLEKRSQRLSEFVITKKRVMLLICKTYAEHGNTIDCAPHNMNEKSGAAKSTRTKPIYINIVYLNLIFKRCFRYRRDLSLSLALTSRLFFFALPRLAFCFGGSYWAHTSP